jgi:hypothetical protein
MQVRELLESACDYIEFRLLWDDQFNLLSLNHCVLEGQVRTLVKDDVVVEARAALRYVTTTLCTPTHDVFPPEEGLAIIRRALVNL